MNGFSPDFARCKRLIEENSGKFRDFYEMLLAGNERFNLTAITEEREVFHKHFLDSLAAEPLFIKGAAVTEVGSGAGFPSLPLKLARDDLAFTLIESTGKKCDFLRSCVKELGLNGVEVVCARAEEAGRDDRYRERADVCTARAVASLPTLAEYCLPFVKKGGLFVAYKGETDETKEAGRAISLLGGGDTACVRYSLPEHYGARTLVCVTKKKQTPSRYPRGNGAERRNPL